MDVEDELPRWRVITTTTNCLLHVWLVVLLPITAVNRSVEARVRGRGLWRRALKGLERDDDNLDQSGPALASPHMPGSSNGKLGSWQAGKLAAGRWGNCLVFFGTCQVSDCASMSRRILGPTKEPNMVMFRFSFERDQSLRFRYFW